MKLKILFQDKARDLSAINVAPDRPSSVISSSSKLSEAPASNDLTRNWIFGPMPQ